MSHLLNRKEQQRRGQSGGAWDGKGTGCTQGGSHREASLE